MLSVLRQILAWGIILTIAVLYFKPIVLCFLLVRKNNAGLPFSGDLTEVETLLRLHPWKEEQELELRDVETGNPYLYLSGHYTGIVLRVKDGNLVGGSGAIVSLRQGYWEAYEANQLLQYISCLSTSEDGSEADKLREQAQTVLTNKEGRDKAQKWLGRIVIFVEIVVLALVLLYAKGKAEAPSSLVKNMVFSDFHYTKTVGSALSSFDPDGKWFDVSEKNALKDNGIAYAGWRGTCRIVSLLGTDENWPLTIYFELELADGDDSYYTSIDRIEFGQYSLLRSNLFQNSAIWDIMNMVYGNQDSAAVTADTGLFDVTYFLSKQNGIAPAVLEATPSPVSIAQSTPVPAFSPEPAAATANGEDRSTWEYEDYVDYYGIDPADYGYMWFNEIKSGPLDEFFDWAIETINEETNASRLYENSWQTDLTPDDFVGTWQTESGITFTIDRTGDDGIIEDYTIDLSGNDLGILGGWFSENIYNIEGDFCGMSGNNGVISFSVTYQYSTDSPETNTWLFLEFVDSEGNTVQDNVPLVQDGIPCV